MIRTLTPPEVVRLEIELSDICNLKCPLCIREVIPNDEWETGTLRDVSAIITQLDKFTNLQYVTIAGATSEPTTHPDLFALISYLKLRGIEISLYINGDTKNDIYYAKLGVLFNGCKGGVYFTICGSTQELHSKYRVGSDLTRVLRHLDIVNRYSAGKGILTWIVFNYNEQDFINNYNSFKQKYETEYFYSLPMQEHFQTQNDIHLPDRLQKIYFDKVDRNASPTECPAEKNKFVQITHTGQVVPCSLYRLYGESHCFECSEKNLTMLRQNKIFNVAESESDTSEIDLRLHYERRA